MYSHWNWMQFNILKALILPAHIRSVNGNVLALLNYTGKNIKRSGVHKGRKWDVEKHLKRLVYITLQNTKFTLWILRGWSRFTMVTFNGCSRMDYLFNSSLPSAPAITRSSLSGLCLHFPSGSSLSLCIEIKGMYGNLLGCVEEKVCDIGFVLHLSHALA